MNPITGMPYDEQLVLRGDYTRVLAEFWADGPDSETPPGHWFVLLNGVSDNPLTVKKFRGEGLFWTILSGTLSLILFWVQRCTMWQFLPGALKDGMIMFDLFPPFDIWLVLAKARTNL